MRRLEDEKIGGMGVVKCFNLECRYHDINMVDNCSKPLTEILKCEGAIIRKETKQSFLSNECLCGKTKKKGNSFCYSCFMALPQDLKNDLYSRMGDGYEEAYDAAVEWLT